MSKTFTPIFNAPILSFSQFEKIYLWGKTCRMMVHKERMLRGGIGKKDYRKNASPTK